MDLVDIYILLETLIALVEMLLAIGSATLGALIILAFWIGWRSSK